MDGRGRGQLGRVLEGLANAVIERALPRVRQLLAARLGENAELDAIELEGARVHLVDLSLPLGARAKLSASRATFSLTRTDELVAGLPPLRLERMEGVAEVKGAPPIRARVMFEAAPSPSREAWVDGTLAVEGMTLAGVRYAGSARARVTSTSFAISAVQLAGESDDAALEGDAGGAFASGSFSMEHARVAVRAIALEAVDHLLSALGVELGALRSALDRDAHGSGSASLEHDRIEGSLSVETEHASAHIALNARIGAGAVEGVIEGRADPAIVRGTHGDELALSGTIGGTTHAPVIVIDARSPRIAVRGLELTRARVTMTRDADGLAIEARARSGAGAMVLTRARSGETRIQLERAEVGALAAEALRWLDRAQLWADAVHADGTVAGAAHLESELVRATLDPLRFAMAGRALDGTTARITLSSRAISSWLPTNVPVRPTEGALELELRVGSGSVAALFDAHADGVARADRVTIAIGDREVAITRISADLSLRGGVLRARARASVLGGTITCAMSVSLSERRVRVTEIEIEGVRDRRVLASLLGLDVEVAIDGRLERESGALRGTLSARTDASSLTLRAVVGDDGALHGTELEGALAVRDIAPWIEGWSLRPHEDATWHLAGQVEGSLRSPRAELDARCPHQRVRARDVDLDGYDLSARVRVTRRRIVWSALEARGYGGVLRSRGSSIRGSTTSAHVEVEGVGVGSLPLARGTMAAHLEGTLSGALDLFRLSRGATIGRGRVRVEAPVYPLIERARGLVSQLGLPLPDPRGTGALTAEIRLAADEWRASELRAAVAQLGVRGHLVVHHEGALAGRLLVRPDPAWLRESTYLIPVSSLLGEVPLDVTGTIAVPRVTADPLGAADGVLARSTLGRGVREIVETLVPEAFSPPPRTDRAHARLLSTDALLDRLAGDQGDASELFDALLERGLSAEEIATAIAKRR